MKVIEDTRKNTRVSNRVSAQNCFYRQIREAMDGGQMLEILSNSNQILINKELVKKE